MHTMSIETLGQANNKSTCTELTVKPNLVCVRCTVYIILTYQAIGGEANQTEPRVVSGRVVVTRATRPCHSTAPQITSHFKRNAF